MYPAEGSLVNALLDAARRPGADHRGPFGNPTCGAYGADLAFMVVGAVYPSKRRGNSMQRYFMSGLLASALLVVSGVANADELRLQPQPPPTCSVIEETASDLEEALTDLARAAGRVERRSRVQWLAMSASRSIDYIVNEAERIRQIHPRNERRCMQYIRRFRNYTQRQFCPHLLDLRAAFRDSPRLSRNEFVFDAWRDMVDTWETYRDTIGVVGCGSELVGGGR
jgi:hypothetical protein